MMDLAAVIDLFKGRRDVYTRESAAFTRQILQLLADDEPVTPERLAEASGQPVEFTRMTLAACVFAPSRLCVTLFSSPLTVN